MDNEYFEMNELDATHSINAEQDSYREPDSRQSSESDDSGNRTNRQPIAERAVSQPVADKAVKTAAAEGKTNGKQADAKKIGKMPVALVLLGALTIAVAGAVIIGFALNKKDDGYDEKYDLKETVFVTDSDSPGIELISENVLGTGMLCEDCDILSSPEEHAAVEGRLAGGTDVLVYAAEGDYYKVSDAEKNVIGYVLKEKVNTGNIDLGNPDADAEIVDDATGKVVGKEKTKSKKKYQFQRRNRIGQPRGFPCQRVSLFHLRGKRLSYHHHFRQGQKREIYRSAQDIPDCHRAHGCAHAGRRFYDSRQGKMALVGQRLFALLLQVLRESVFPRTDIRRKELRHAVGQQRLCDRHQRFVRVFENHGAGCVFHLSVLLGRYECEDCQRFAARQKRESSFLLESVC